MYVAINGTGNNKSVYIMQSFRKEDGKTSSRVFRKLGKLDELLDAFDGNKDKMLAWAKTEALKDTDNHSHKSSMVTVSLSQSAYIPLNEERSFNVGYLFLQKLCSQLHMDNICRNMKNRHHYEYDLNAIMTDLIYARILSPGSKMSSYSFCSSLLEPPKYELHDVYRALTVLSKESDFIQEEVYRNSNHISPRNTKILYYDCTNYFFEIEQEDDIRRYGKSKEHRPNPIVSMGLFMDADGVPLAFDIFPGNQNEQSSLKPIEAKIIRDFDCSEFVFCSDAGLGSKENRRFNRFGNRSYVITHSIKKLKAEDKALALNPSQYRRLGSNAFVDLTTLDETDEEIFNTIYYKEIPVVNGDMHEILIVTYSPKYKEYQRKIRNTQVERASKLVSAPEKQRKGKSQNDPARFIKQTAITDDGELANKTLFDLDRDKIADEEQYDGFYAVITNLEDNISEILKVNRQRWEIEENFRIMKTEFEARPVYVRREDRIKAHFLICFLSLLIYRLLEKKLDNSYTCEEILETLRKMQMTLLTKNSGYTPSYKRTVITDMLHEKFGFHTDYEYISKSSMRSIIKNSKERE